LSDVLGSREDSIMEYVESVSEIAALNKAVNSLPPRERQITSLRYGLNGRREYTQKEVADALNISQSYVSRLEKKILGKLKRELENAF
jgi:RNA polymerase sporulation-specific sigma factor